jgi:O-antigen/teichoic acid export membrane protein
MIKSIVNVGLQAILKLLFSVFSLKIVAYYAGPSGIAVYGQLQSFLQMTSAGASSMTSTGVVKLVSEGRYAESNVLKTSLSLLLAYTGILFIVFLISSDMIAVFFLGGGWRAALILMPLAAFFVGVSSLYVSYYNGRQDYRSYLFVSIIMSFLTAAFTVGCAFYFKKEGAIYSVVIAPIGAGIVTLFCFRGWMRDWRTPSFGGLSSIVKTLLQFSLMALGSAVVVYGGQIYLRHFIAGNVSVDAAGIWYSATRLSDIYVGIASILFSTILLPRYSALSGKPLTSEVLKMLWLGSVFALIMVVVVKIASGWVVHIIYGASFEAASDILDVYVFGDALKLLTWIFLYVFIAKQQVLFYLVYEVFSAAGYVVFSTIAFKYLNFNHMAIGYVVQVSISLAVLVCWFLRFYSTSASEVKVAND